MKKLWLFLSLLMVAVLALTACQPKTEEGPAAEEEPATEAAQPVVFGMLMVGPYNDHGWSEAHYDAGMYVQEKLVGSEFIYTDKVNVADRPDSTPAQLAEELIDRGAQVIIFNSDDMKESAHEFTANHPEIYVIHASGDGAWVEGNGYKGYENLYNTMGKMEYGKMMAGCAAALTTKTGKIGYLGPLINEETRRLAASVYLGANYCWENYRGETEPLTFKVTWIGFWFNIPGFTQDPTQVADDFFNSDFDVVISGIDTTEALVEANTFAGQGKEVYAIPYDYKSACDTAPDVCLGTPYFNWGPEYLRVITDVANGTFEPGFTWLDPDWADINNPDTSAVGFVKGNALSAENATTLDGFIAELAGGLNLFIGPLNYQDGSEFLAEGVAATDLQIWYLPQLLEGMEGQSLP